MSAVFTLKSDSKRFHTLINFQKMPLHITSQASASDKHEYDINCLLFHKGSLYSAGDDGKIKLWSPDLKCLQEVQAHPCSVYCLTASDDTLYSCSNEGTVKSWELDSLKEKQTLLKDEEAEFWRVQYNQGVLYIGDDQGNVRLYKNEKFYDCINVAIPVKDLLVDKNLLITAKDNDVIVTDLHIEGKKIQFGIKATIIGRGPLGTIDDKLIFISRDGRDVILHKIGEQQHINETSKVNGAHDMIINALVAVNWNDTLIFTGGWDKIVKQWKIDGDSLKPDGSCGFNYVINAMVAGEKGHIYVGGSDGHLAGLEL